jgi:uncharacterized membrane protein YfcA
MLGLTLPQIALALAIVFVGAVVQGAAGLGYALVAAPLLALIDPALAPQAVLGTASLLSLLIAARERHAVAAGEIKWALTGYLPGALLASALLARLPARGLSILFAALVLLAVALSTLRPRLAIAAKTLLPAGLLSGFMGTTSSIGGPPIALLYQNSKGSHIRATLGLYFSCGGMLSIAVLALSGRFGLLAAEHNLLLLPGVLLGFALSGRFIPTLDRGPIRPVILAISAVSALAVLVRTLLIL